MKNKFSKIVNGFEEVGGFWDTWVSRDGAAK
jgi:hypothetical protein